MAIYPKSNTLWMALPTLSLLTLPACTEAPKPNQAHTANDYQVDRYKVVHLPQTGETLEIDTATGKTWLLARTAPEDGGEVIGWELIKDIQS